MVKPTDKRRPRTQANPGEAKKPKRDQVLQVVVTAEDKALIERRAASARLSLSTFLRNVGLGIEIHSSADLDIAMDIVKLNGDLNRLGGLLKLWLSEYRGRAPVPFK